VSTGWNNPHAAASTDPKFACLMCPFSEPWPHMPQRSPDWLRGSASCLENPTLVNMSSALTRARSLVQNRPEIVSILLLRASLRSALGPRLDINIRHQIPHPVVVHQTNNFVRPALSLYLTSSTRRHRGRRSHRLSGGRCVDGPGLARPRRRPCRRGDRPQLHHPRSRSSPCSRAVVPTQGDGHAEGALLWFTWAMTTFLRARAPSASQ